MGSLVGGIIGGVLGLAGLYEDKKNSDRQEKLAEEQLENQRRLQQEQDQARRKSERNEADVSGLLSDNTRSSGGGVTLTPTGGQAINPNTLGGGNKLLGG